MLNKTWKESNQGWNQTLEGNIPIQGGEELDKINEMMKEMHADDWSPFKPTDYHVDKLIDAVYEGIEKVGEAGGWYMNDGIRVKIEFEYEPENK